MLQDFYHFYTQHHMVQIVHGTKLTQLSDKLEVLMGVQYSDRNDVKTQNEPWEQGLH